MKISFTALCITLAALYISSPALATEVKPVDSFGGSDKTYHVVVSAAVGVAVAAQWPEKPWLTQFGIAMIPGVLKELSDKKISGKDLAADAVGAAIGVSIGRVFISRRDGTTTVALAIPL